MNKQPARGFLDQVTKPPIMNHQSNLNNENVMWFPMTQYQYDREELAKRKPGEEFILIYCGKPKKYILVNNGSDNLFEIMNSNYPFIVPDWTNGYKGNATFARVICIMRPK